MAATLTGEMRERITITQVAAAAQDSVGGDVETLSTLATVWAKVEPLAARERVGVGDAVTSAIAYRITIRFRDDITPMMRLTRGSDTLQIAAVLQDGRRAFTVLECAGVDR